MTEQERKKLLLMFGGQITERSDATATRFTEAQKIKERSRSGNFSKADAAVAKSEAASAKYYIDREKARRRAAERRAEEKKAALEAYIKAAERRRAAERKFWDEQEQYKEEKSKLDEIDEIDETYERLGFKKDDEDEKRLSDLLTEGKYESDYARFRHKWFGNTLGDLLDKSSDLASKMFGQPGLSLRNAYWAKNAIGDLLGDATKTHMSDLTDEQTQLDLDKKALEVHQNMTQWDEQREKLLNDYDLAIQNASLKLNSGQKLSKQESDYIDQLLIQIGELSNNLNDQQNIDFDNRYKVGFVKRANHYVDVNAPFWTRAKQYAKSLGNDILELGDKVYDAAASMTVLGTDLANREQAKRVLDHRTQVYVDDYNTNRDDYIRKMGGNPYDNSAESVYDPETKKQLGNGNIANEKKASDIYERRLGIETAGAKMAYENTAKLNHEFDKWMHVDEGYEAGKQSHQSDKLWSPGYWQYCVAGMIGSSNSSPELIASNAAQLASMALGPEAMFLTGLATTPLDIKGALRENKAEATDKRVDNFQELMKGWDGEFQMKVMDDMRDSVRRSWKELGMSDQWINKRLKDDKSVLQDVFAGYGKESTNNPLVRQALLDSMKGLLALKDADNTRTMWETVQQKAVDYCCLGLLMKGGRKLYQVGSKAKSATSRVGKEGKLVASFQNKASSADRVGQYSNGFKRDLGVWSAMKSGWKQGSALGEVTGFGGPGSVIGGSTMAIARGANALAQKALPRYASWCDDVAEKLMFKYQKVIDTMEKYPVPRFLRRYGIPYTVDLASKAVGESFEESVQYLNSKKDFASIYGYDGMTFYETMANDIVQGGRAAEAYLALMGLTNSDLMDDQEFWDNAKGGFALGAHNPGPSQIIQTYSTINGLGKKWNAYDAIMQTAAILREGDRINRASWTGLANIVSNGDPAAAMAAMEQLKQDDSRRENPNFRQEDYDASIDALKGIAALHRDKKVQQRLKDMGVKVGTKEYNTALADLYNLHSKLTENKKELDEVSNILLAQHNSKEFLDAIDEYMKKDDVDPDAIAEQEREIVKRRNEIKEKKVLEAKQSGVDVESDEFKLSLKEAIQEDEKLFLDARHTERRNTLVKNIITLSEAKALLSLKAKSNTLNDVFEYMSNKVNVNTRRPDAKYVIQTIDAQLNAVKLSLKKTDPSFNEKCSDAELLLIIENSNLPFINTSGIEDLYITQTMLAADKAVTTNYLSMFYGFQQPQVNKETGEITENKNSKKLPVYVLRINAIIKADEENKKIDWLTADVYSGDAVTKLNDDIAKEMEEVQKEALTARVGYLKKKAEEEKKKAEGEKQSVLNQESTLTVAQASSTTEQLTPAQQSNNNAAKEVQSKLDANKKKYQERKAKLIENWKKRRNSRRGKLRASVLGPLEVIYDIAQDISTLARMSAYKIQQFVQDVKDVYGQELTSDDIGYAKQRYYKALIAARIKSPEILANMSTPDEVLNYGSISRRPYIKPQTAHIPNVAVISAQLTDMAGKIDEDVSTYYDTFVNENGTTAIYPNIADYDLHEHSGHRELRQLVSQEFQAALNDENAFKALLLKYALTEKYSSYRSVPGLCDALGRAIVLRMQETDPRIALAKDVRALAIAVFMEDDDEIDRITQAYPEFPLMQNIVSELEGMKDKMHEAHIEPLTSNTLIYGTDANGNKISLQLDLLFVDAEGRVHVVDVLHGYASVHKRWDQRPGGGAKYTIHERESAQARQLQSIIGKLQFVNIATISTLPIISDKDGWYTEPRIPLIDKPTKNVELNLAPTIEIINQAIDEYNQLYDLCEYYGIQFMRMPHVELKTFATSAEREAYSASLSEKLDNVNDTKKYVQQQIDERIAEESSVTDHLTEQAIKEVPEVSSEDKLLRLHECCLELDAKMDEVPDMTPTTQDQKDIFDQFLVAVMDAQDALNEVLIDKGTTSPNIPQELELIASAMEKLAKNKGYFGVKAVNVMKWWLTKIDPVNDTNTTVSVNTTAPLVIATAYYNTITSWINVLTQHLQQDLDNDTQLQKWYKTLLDNHFTQLVDNAERLLNDSREATRRYGTIGIVTSFDGKSGMLAQLSQAIFNARAVINDFNNRYQVDEDEEVLESTGVQEVDDINKIPIKWIDRLGKTSAHSLSFSAMRGGHTKQLRTYASIYEEISTQPDFLQEAYIDFNISGDGQDIMVFIKYKDKSCYIPLLTDINVYPEGSLTQLDIDLIERSNKVKREFLIPKLKLMIQYKKSHRGWVISFGKSLNKGEIVYDRTSQKSHNVQEFLFTNQNSKDLYTIRLSDENGIGVLIKRDPGTEREQWVVCGGDELKEDVRGLNNRDFGNRGTLKAYNGSIIVRYNTGNGDFIPVRLERSQIGPLTAEKLADLILMKLNGLQYVDGYSIDDLLDMALYMDDPNKRASAFSNTKNKIKLDYASKTVIIGGEPPYSFQNRSELVNRLSLMQITTDSEMLNQNLSVSTNSVFSSVRQDVIDKNTVTLPNGFVINRDDVVHQNKDNSRGSTWLGYLLRNGYIGTRATKLGYKQLNISDPILVRQEQASQIEQKRLDVEKQKEQQQLVVQQVKDSPDVGISIFMGDGPMLGNSKLNMTIAKEEIVVRSDEQVTEFAKLAKEYFEKVFGSSDRLKIEDYIEHSLIPGAVAAGYCSDQFAVLAKYAPESAIYHEAFHKIMELVLPNSQREFFYNAYRSKYGANLSEREVAEGLTDLFVDYVQHNMHVKRATGFGKITNWFKKVVFNVGFVCKVGPLKASKFYLLYSNINSGAYANKQISQQNIDRFNRVFGTNEGAKLFYTVENKNLKNGKLEFLQIKGLAELNDLVSTLSTIYVAAVGLDSHDVLWVQKQVGKVSINESTAEKMVEYLEAVKLDEQTLKELYPKIAEVFEYEVVDTEEKDKKGNPITKKVYPKFNAIMDKLAEYVSDQIGSDYKGKFKNDEDDEDEQTLKSNIDKYDRASYEFSKLDSASSRIKFFLSTFIRKTPEGGFDHSKNSTGWEVFIPVTEVFTRLVHDFGLARSISELLTMMDALQNKSPLHKDVYEKFKKAIAPAYSFDENKKLVVNYDAEQFAIQFFTCIKSQDMNFVLARTKFDGPRKYTDIIPAGSERDAIQYPKTWNSLLTSGLLSVFSETLTEDGRLQVLPGHEKDLLSVAEFFQRVIDGVGRTMKVRVRNEELDLTSPQDFQKLKQEIVKALHYVGILFPEEALVHMLEENFSTKEYSGNSVDGLRVWLTQRGTNSITPFLQILNRWIKNGVVDEKISEDGYTKSGFVKFLGNAYSSYTKLTTLSMVQALNGKQLYSISQNSSLSYIINALNSHNEDNHVIRTLKKFAYNLFDNNGIWQGSNVLKRLANGDDIHLTLHTYIGQKTDHPGDTGTEYSDSPEVDDYMAKLAMLQAGYIVPCTFADKGTWQIIYGANLPGMSVKTAFDEDGKEVVQLGGLPRAKKYGDDWVLIPLNDVLDQMIEYATTETVAILKCMDDLGYDKIPGYKKSRNGSISDPAKIKNYHTSVKVKLKDGTVKIIEPNGTRFLRLTQLAVPTKDGIKIINLNDPNKGSVKLLELALKEFFSKTIEERREIMALTMHIQTMEAIEFAQSRGIVEREDIQTTVDGRPHIEYSSKDRSSLTRTLTSKHLDSKQIGILLNAFMAQLGWDERFKYDGRQSAIAKSVCKSLAVQAILQDATYRSVMSVEECTRLFIGHPGMFKVQYDLEKGIVKDSTGDLQKRIGGIVSTGDDNYMNDIAGLRSVYTCALLDDYEIGLPKLQLAKMLELFTNSAVRDVVADIIAAPDKKVLILEAQERRRIEAALQSSLASERSAAREALKSLDSDIQLRKQLEREKWNKVFNSSDEELNSIIDNLKPELKKQVEKARKDALKYTNAYSEKINVADGAAYITDEMCELMLRERGAYNYDVKKAFDILRNEDADHSWTKKAEAFKLIYEKTAIVATKYTAYGVREHTLNGEQLSDLAVPYYNKFALFPIFPCLATGKMKQVYQKMKDESVDMLFMDSAVKVGSQGSMPVSDIDKPFNKYTQHMGFLRRLLNTDPEEGTRIALGTQMIKIVLSNLRLGRQYGDKTGQELLDDLMANIDTLRLIGEQEVEEMFFTNGKVDNKKLSNFLKNELSSKGANKTVLDALEVTYNENTGEYEFECPAAATPDARWMESIIRSTICKRVVDVTTPGSSFIQRSVFAIEAEDGESLILGDNSPYYHGLKLLLINEHGSMDAVISIDYFKSIIPDGLGFEEARQWLIDNKIIGPDADTMTIGYRIPTLAQSSIHALRFVDVLPATLAAIVLPEAFTKVTGSDFDIDHLYLASLNYSRVQDDILTGGDESFKTDYLSKDSYDLTDKLNAENNILKTMINLLCDTDNSMSMLFRSIDNDTELPKSLADMIPSSAEDNKKHLPYNFGTLHELVRRKSDYMTGKSGIGPFALNVTSQVLTYLYEVEFNDSEFTRKTPIKSLHHLRDVDGNYVSSWISAFINAHVDIVKDPWIRQLDINPFTYNTISLLVRSGVGEAGCWFCAQPIIRDLAEASKKAESMVLLEEGKGKALYRNELYDEVLKKYGINQTWKLLLAWGKDKAQIQQRITAVNNTITYGVLAMKDQAIDQSTIDNGLLYDVVKAFIALLPYSQGLSQLLQYTKVDTRKYGKNFIQMRVYLEKYQDAFFNSDTSVLDLASVRRMLTESWIDKKTESAIGLPLHIMGELTFDANNQFYDVVKNFSYRIVHRAVNLQEEVMELISQHLRTAIKLRFINEYAHQQLGMTDQNIRQLFFGIDEKGTRSMALRLDGIKVAVLTMPEYLRLADNYLINKLISKVRPDNVATPEGRVAQKPRFITVSQDVNGERMNEDALTDAWLELLIDENKHVRKFAEDLIVYAMYSSGEFSGFDKFAKAIPFQWITGKIQDVNVVINGVTYKSFAHYIKSQLSNLDNEFKTDEMLDTIAAHLTYKYEIVRTVKEKDKEGHDNFVANTNSSVIITKPDSLADDDGNNPEYIRVKKSYCENSKQSSYNLYVLVGETENHEAIYVNIKNKGYKNSTENIYEYWLDFDFAEYDNTWHNKTDVSKREEVVTFVINHLGKEMGVDEVTKLPKLYADTEIQYTASKIYSGEDPNMGVQSTQSVRKRSVMTKSTKKYSRDEVEKNPRTLYIFTDNTDRTSKGAAYGEGWYKEKYGEGGYGSKNNPTTALIRGLDNAAPISTMRYLYSIHGMSHPKYDPNSEARWHDKDFDEFKAVFDDEIEQIKKLWDSGRFDNIITPMGYGFFGSPLTDISKQRTPKIYEYMHEKLWELYEYVNKPKQTPTSNGQTESVNTNTLHGRQATHEEELATLNSGKTILSNEELAVWNKAGVGPNPRILVATEKSDAAFHSKEIVDIINGIKRVTNKKYTVITKEEYDSLPIDLKWYKQATNQYFRIDTTSFNPSDFAGLYIITKHDGIPMRNILATKIPKLIHFSITGLGGTVYEPGVMKPNDLLDRIGDYIKQGLDPDIITVRIDPIVPGVTTPSMIENIVKRASELGIKRIRFSIMDAYKNTVNKMLSLGYDFDSKYHWAKQDGVNRRVVNDDVKNSIVNFMLSMKDKYDVTIGTCAEDIHVNGITNEGCLSVASVNRMLGSNIEDRGTANNNQRVLCSCYGGKVDALAYDKYCGSACAYCYGKHENDAVYQYYNQDGTLKHNNMTDSGYRELSPETVTHDNAISKMSFYSGGAAGADTAWGDAILAAGGKVKHFTVRDYDALPQNQKDEIEKQYQYVVSMLNRRPLSPSSYAGKLVRRDMMQANAAERVLAIGTIDHSGRVNGGTAYAVTKAINDGKSVILFDQDSNTWKYWYRAQAEWFPAPETPTLTDKTAVIGTREITDVGRKAIQDVVNKTLLTTETSPVNNTNTGGENISSKGSDFAKRLTNPFNNETVQFRGVIFDNAEHAYQTWKSGKFDQNGYAAHGRKVRGATDFSSNYQLMVDIITAKLQQHPDLVQGINERGGMEYLNASTHNVVGDLYWETSGLNKFIEALKEAFLKAQSDVKTQSNKNDNVVTNNITLTSELKHVVDNVVDFIENKMAGKGDPNKPFVTIQGMAGTGKTTIVKSILRKLEDDGKLPTGISVAALSRKAVHVLYDKIRDEFKVSAESVYTLAGAEPNVSEDRFAINPDKSKLPAYKIIFIDEASMIGKHMFDVLTDYITANPEKVVVFLGDYGQLRPIPKNTGKIVEVNEKSPVFLSDKTVVETLTQRIRLGEDSPILSYADKFYNVSIGKSSDNVNDLILDNTVITDKGALIIEKGTLSTLSKILPLFKKAHEDKRTNYVKFVAGTNERVRQLNNIVHNSLYPNQQNQISVGDMVIFNESYTGLEEGGHRDNKNDFILVDNSQEGVVVQISDIYQREDGIKFKTFVINVGDYNVQIDVMENDSETVSIYRKRLDFLLNTARKTKRGADWRNYYEFMQRFANIGLSYAITTHKALGSTYDIVIVDANNIASVTAWSNTNLAENMYTALTRSRNISIVLSRQSGGLSVDSYLSLNERIETNKSKNESIQTSDSEDIQDMDFGEVGLILSDENVKLGETYKNNCERR